VPFRRLVPVPLMEVWQAEVRHLVEAKVRPSHPLVSRGPRLPDQEVWASPASRHPPEVVAPQQIRCRAGAAGTCREVELVCCQPWAPGVFQTQGLCQAKGLDPF